MREHCACRGKQLHLSPHASRRVFPYVFPYGDFVRKHRSESGQLSTSRSCHHCKQKCTAAVAAGRGLRMQTWKGHLKLLLSYLIIEGFPTDGSRTSMGLWRLVDPLTVKPLFMTGERMWAISYFWSCVIFRISSEILGGYPRKSLWMIQEKTQLMNKCFFWSSRTRRKVFGRLLVRFILTCTASLHKF